MRKGKRKLNQAGMSLVELVVVILIIGILSAGTGIGVTFVNRMNATSATEKLASALERTRVRTIASDKEVKLVLEKDGNDYYGRFLEGGVEIDTIRIGNSALTIKVDGSVLNDASSYEFSYKKSNGAFQSTYTKIVVEGSKTKTVYMVNATGRCYIE